MQPQGLDRQKIVAIAAIAGGLLMVVGSFLTWGEISTFGQTVSFNGVEDGRDGIFTLVAGAAAAVIGFALFTGAKVPNFLRGSLLLWGLIGLAIAFIDYGDISTRFEEVSEGVGGDLIETSIGPGVWVIGLGGLIVLIGGASSFIGGRSSSGSGITAPAATAPAATYATTAPASTAPAATAPATPTVGRHDITTRQCPFCKEDIKPDASACPHCQRDIDPWTFHDGYWWAQHEGQWYWRDTGTGEWHKQPVVTEGPSGPPG